MGGVIVEGGTYDWNNGKYPMLSEPSESYHGLRFSEAFGQLAFIAKCRAEGVRDLGCCISPFNSFMIMQGIETLSLRVQREADNALALARYFKAHPLVEQVFYPGLEDDPAPRAGRPLPASRLRLRAVGRAQGQTNGRPSRWWTICGSCRIWPMWATTAR